MAFFLNCYIGYDSCFVITKCYFQLNLEEALNAGRLKDEEIAKLKALVARQENTIEDLNAKAREHETTRRKLHNTIQELKVQ